MKDPRETLPLPGDPRPKEVIDCLRSQLQWTTFHAGWIAGFSHAFQVWGGERPTEVPDTAIAHQEFKALEGEPELSGSVVDSDGVPDVDAEWRVFFQGWMVGLRFGHEQSEGKPAEFPPESVAFKQFEDHKAGRKNGAVQ